MVPCGIAGVTMTSVEQELLRSSTAGAPTASLGAEVRSAVVRAAGEVFSLVPTEADESVMEPLEAAARPSA